MNYNPYAPPQAAPPAPPGGPAAFAGGPQPWDIGEVVGAAFEGFKANWVVLVFTHVVALIALYIPIIISVLPGATGVIRMGTAPDVLLRIVGYVFGLVVYAFFQVGLLRISLGVARGRQPVFSELFSGGDQFVQMVLAFLAVSLGAWIGCALLVVPGVILGLGLSLTTYFIADQGLGAADALRASWQATDGQKVKLFVFGIVAFLIILGSELLCCFPVLAAIPVISVAFTIVYLRITGRGGPPVPALGGPPPGYGPPGGGPAYGPGGGGPGGYGPPGGGPGYGPPGGGGPGFGGPGFGGGGPGGYGGPGGAGGPGGGPGGYGPGGGRPPGY